jgi:nitrite reductase/ring-hydroxylating ferredoxin subunit
MITRWNRNCSRKYWILAVLFFGCVLSVAAWLASVPTLPSTAQQRYKDSNSLVRLEAKQEGKNEKKTESESGGYFGFFSGEKKETDKEKQDSEEEGSAKLFRSIQNRFENMKEARKAKPEAELDKNLDAMLDKEIGEGGFLLPNVFNISFISSALGGVEAGLKQKSDELRSVRAVTEQLTEEEKKLEELRNRVAAERKAKVQAQKLADQRTIDRREQKKKQLMENEAKAKKRAELGKKVREASVKGDLIEENEEAESSKRSNPLSVAQKFVFNRLEKQKSQEEWIVVAPKTRISPGEIVPISTAGLDLLLVASKDGSALHCIANSCPHLGTPLETGILDRRPVEPTESPPTKNSVNGAMKLQETDISRLLTQDGCEDCIVCPLHQTAFALESGEVRGEWCPYPPVLGKVMGTVKNKDNLPVFDVRTKGKNIEVRLNTPIKVDKF